MNVVIGADKKTRFFVKYFYSGTVFGYTGSLYQIFVLNEIQFFLFYC